MRSRPRTHDATGARALLSHVGHEVVPLDGFFNQLPGSEKVGLVLIDGHCLTPQLVARLMPFLATQSVCAAVVLESGVHAPDGTEDLPRLDIVFSRREVADFLAVQPA